MAYQALVILLCLIQYVSAAAVEALTTLAPSLAEHELKARQTTTPINQIGYVNTQGSCE
jgi:hypothetical protein